MNVEKCLVCGKELEGMQKKYCSTSCEQKYFREKNKEKIKEYQKIRYKKNKEKVREYQQINRDRDKKARKIWCKKNKEKIKENNKLYKEKNKESIKKKRRTYEIENRDEIYLKAKEYYKNNRKKLKKKRKIYQIENKQIIDEKRRRYKNKRYKEDTLFKLNHNIGVNIRHIFKLNKMSKNGRHWEYLVGYTAQELKEHLEGLFRPGMTWDNYGKNGWEIDHIIPKSFFKFRSTDDTEFKYCWSLMNLQPLWAKENLDKRDRIIKYFK